MSQQYGREMGIAKAGRTKSGRKGNFRVSSLFLPLVHNVEPKRRLLRHLRFAMAATETARSLNSPNTSIIIPPSLETSSRISSGGFVFFIGQPLWTSMG